MTISDNLASVSTPPSVFVTTATPVVGQTYVCTVIASNAGNTRTATLTMTP